MADETPYAVEMLHITKKFPGIIANDDITLQLKKGEIHALLGENGAGKSTLMSVLFGLYQAEEGTIKKDGQIVQIHDPTDANRLGIGIILAGHLHILAKQAKNVYAVLTGINRNVAARRVAVGTIVKRAFRLQLITSPPHKSRGGDR